MAIHSIEIERINRSVTQGEVKLTFNGEILGQFGDTMTLKNGEWIGRPDSYWMGVALSVAMQRGLIA